MRNYLEDEAVIDAKTLLYCFINLIHKLKGNRVLIFFLFYYST